MTWCTPAATFPPPSVGGQPQGSGIVMRSRPRAPPPVPRHGRPELRVVAVEEAGARVAQRPQVSEGSEHPFTVVREGREAELLERTAEVAGVRGEDDLAV